MIEILAWVVGWAALGAFLYRLRGGPRWLDLPSALKELAVVAHLMAPAVLQAAHLPAEGWAWGFPAWALGTLCIGAALTFRGVTFGHGQYFDEGTSKPKPNHPEDPYIRGHNEEGWLAWLRHRWIFPRGTIGGSRAAYEYLALALTGLATTAAPGAALMALGQVWQGAVLAASGLLKAPAYWIGWRLLRRAPTECGEWLTGAFYGAGAGVGLAWGGGYAN